ncbi:MULTISPECIES: VCBS domain-containing protein [unclassified Mycobacterium]|uniref:Ig-like domain-containing protein n=1 Tax=unclassified Mycobacterium TaxID=2642494 RepID=UPI000B0CC52F|nr:MULTISPECIES: VCBS domain-containing protein [unclassified Mycobacterium]
MTAAAAAPTTQTTSTAATVAASATAAVPAVVAAQVASPATGLVGFLNGVVTNLLNPFLKPVPHTPEPFGPAVWAVLAWVRRNVFNQAPTIAYNPTTTVQTEQTVTGNLGATDPEGDALTYKVTQGPKYGTLTIDQATGNFTYTPNDINYTAVQTDSFSVSVTDGKFNLLKLFSPHSAKAGIDVSVLNPEVERVILNLPNTIASPANPRYSADGKSIFFAGQPTSGGRSEIYQIKTDGTALQCVTCGVSVGETGNLAKPVPVDDGSGRVLVLVNVAGQTPRYSMLETGINGTELVSITTPAGGGYAIDPQREMRVSPDGTHVLYTRIVIGPNNLLQALPIVGTLTRTDTGYTVTDARVVYPTGEGKDPGWQGCGDPRRPVRRRQCGRHRGRPRHRQGDQGDGQPRLRRGHGLLAEYAVDRHRQHARAECADTDDADHPAELPAGVRRRTRVPGVGRPDQRLQPGMDRRRRR